MNDNTCNKSEIGNMGEIVFEARVVRNLFVKFVVTYPADNFRLEYCPDQLIHR